VHLLGRRLDLQLEGQLEWSLVRMKVKLLVVKRSLVRLSELKMV